MRNLKTIGAIAAGALAATALTGMAVATTAIADEETSSPDGTTQGMTGADDDTEGRGPRAHRGEPDGHAGPGGHGGLAGLAGKAMGMVHGEVVVETEDGTYVTQLVQRGEVTAVSESSITVVSEDGFEATYEISPDTDSKRDREENPAEVGDTVHIVGVVDDSVTTAEVIMAMSPEAAAQFEAQREAMQEWMSQRPEGFGGKGGQRGWGGKTAPQGMTTPSLAG